MKARKASSPSAPPPALPHRMVWVRFQILRFESGVGFGFRRTSFAVREWFEFRFRTEWFGFGFQISRFVSDFSVRFRFRGSGGKVS